MSKKTTRRCSRCRGSGKEGVIHEPGPTAERYPFVFTPPGLPTYQIRNCSYYSGSGRQDRNQL